MLLLRSAEISEMTREMANTSNKIALIKAQTVQ